ncbi:calcium-binding protein, partial [Aquaspirillum soli]
MAHFTLLPMMAQKVVPIDVANHINTGDTAATITISGKYADETPPPAPTPTPTPEPTPVPTPVPVPTPTPAGTFDGVTVNETVQTDGTRVVSIPVVTDEREDDPTTPQQTHADIPVVKNAAGESILTVSVPTGVGMTVEGKAEPQSKTDALAELLRRIEQKNTGNNNQQEMKDNGNSFLNLLQNDEKLIVKSITPTVPANTNQAPAAPIIINGSDKAGDGKQAVVIDVSQLPKGTVIQVHNIDFIAIVGEVRAVGGKGQNVAVGDNLNQFIVLGADDDTISGGGGVDTVGSLGGNDIINGDTGDDIVYGGAGNDSLTGGVGNDRLNGGFGNDTAIQSGARSDYTISVDGHTVVLTHKTSGEIDRLLDVELVKFDSGDNLTIRYGEVFTAEYDPNVLNMTANRQFTGGDGNEMGYLPLGLALNVDGGKGHDVLKLTTTRADYAMERNGNALEITRYTDGA